MNVVNAHLDNLKIQINTNLEADQFFSKYKYLEFKGQLYIMTQMIRNKYGIEAEFASHSGPIDGDVKKINEEAN